MKKLIIALLGFVVTNAYAQIEMGASVSNNGTYQTELNIMDSTVYRNKKTVFTMQKGIGVMTYSIKDIYNYYRETTGEVPSGNNFYMGTLIRIGSGKQSVVSSDIGFGIGLARTYSSKYDYNPNTGMETEHYTYEGYETAIGMTWGINVQIMNHVDTYFKAGGLFREYGGFSAVGFKYTF